MGSVFDWGAYKGPLIVVSPFLSKIVSVNISSGEIKKRKWACRGLSGGEQVPLTERIRTGSRGGGTESTAALSNRMLAYFSSSHV